jgi:hypothetical protein
VSELLDVALLASGTFICALVLVLRFLSSNHLVRADREQLRAELETLRRTTQKSLDECSHDIAQEKARLTQLSNRVR